MPERTFEQLVADHREAAAKQSALKQLRTQFIADNSAVFEKERELLEAIHAVSKIVADTRDEINARIEGAKTA